MSYKSTGKNIKWSKSARKEVHKRIAQPLLMTHLCFTYQLNLPPTKPLNRLLLRQHWGQPLGIRRWKGANLA